MSTPWWTVTVAGGVISSWLAQVGAERRGRRAGRRVLDDAADRERVARVERRLVLAVDEVDRRRGRGASIVALSALEVVVEVGEALAGGGAEDQVAGAGVGDPRRERGVEVVARSSRALRARASSRSSGTSSTCGTTLVSVAVTAPLAPWVSTGTAPACVWKTQRAGAVALGERDAGGDRRVPAERDLGLGAEVADVVAAVARAASTNADSRVAELGGDLLHLVVVEGARVEHDAGRVAALGGVGERRVAQDRWGGHGRDRDSGRRIGAAAVTLLSNRRSASGVGCC